MRCCVPFCETDAQNVSESAGITFHEFPSEEHHRAAWLRALGIQDSPLPDSVVCSRHFLNEDICVTQCGSRQIRTGAIPSTVQVCMICLDTQSKLFLISKYKLEGVYEQLLGLPLCDKRNLKQTLCVQCAQRLVNFNKFRDKSLKVHSLMMELVERHELITIQHIKSICQVKSDIVKTVLEPDHYNVCITHSDAHTDTEPDTTIESVAVKSEEKDDSMSVDEDRTEQHTVVMIEGNNDADSFNEHSVAFKEEYLSDENSPSEAMKNRLLITPSTSKQFPELETTVQIKNEITIACTTCLEEFTNENMYLQHMMKHLEDDQNLDEYIISDYPHTSAAGVAPNLETSRRRTVDPSEGAGEVDTNDKNLRIGGNASETSQTYQIEIEVDTGVSEIDPLATGHSVDEEITDVDSGKLQCRTSDDIVQTVSQIVEPSVSYVNITSNSDEEEETTFNCTLCNFKTNAGKILASHIDVHFKQNDIKIIFGCDHCHYITNVKDDLIKHLQVHNNDVTHACDQCSYKTTEEVLLQKHVKRCHAKKPFMCTFCEFRCATMSSLRRHKRTHTDVMVVESRSQAGVRFACQVCPHKTSRKSDLVRHLTAHIGDKPYSCKLCDYMCSRRSDLDRHWRTHTGEKPYTCDLCPFKCAQRCGLLKHMVRTHRRRLND